MTYIQPALSVTNKLPYDTTPYSSGYMPPSMQPVRATFASQEPVVNPTMVAQPTVTSTPLTEGLKVTEVINKRATAAEVRTPELKQLITPVKSKYNDDFESTLNKNLKIARQNKEYQIQEHIQKLIKEKDLNQQSKLAKQNKEYQTQEHIKNLMEEYETKKYLHMVTDHPFTTDNIYTGTPDTFEDVNPQQEQALYTKTSQSRKNLEALVQRVGKEAIEKQRVERIPETEEARRNRKSNKFMEAIKMDEKRKEEEKFNKEYYKQNKEALKHKRREHVSKKKG